MARGVGVLPGLLLGALLFASAHVFLGFVSPIAPKSPASYQPAQNPIALRARGGARGGGPDIDAWIAEALGGSGGPPQGAIKEYVLKWFWRADEPFTGPGKAPGKKDHNTVYATLKDVVAQGPAFDRGSASAGFASVNGETSGVDGSPYTWVVGSMTPGGMYLFVTREFPGGMGVRPLFACKIGEEEAMWSKLDWNMVNKRLDITAGANLEKVEGTKQR
jgi:hypothetical protein